MAAVAADVIGVVGGSLGILFTVVNGIQQTQNLRLEKKKLNLEIKKVLLEIIQAANIENVMKCFTTFEALANKSGFIPIKNNSIINDLGIDNKAWEEIDTNGDNLIEMNEWIQFWFQLEKETNYCQFCKEPKFETCFICMRGFCAEHYQYEKTSEKKLCSDCIKKHHNDPKRLAEAVITKLKEIKEYEKEKIIVQKKTHKLWHWKPGLYAHKCGVVEDCKNIGALKCHSCGTICCSICISKRIISSKYACPICHTIEKRKLCYTRKCKDLSGFTCNNINCENVACFDHATAILLKVEIDEVLVSVPITVCDACAAVPGKVKGVRLPLRLFAQEYIDCYNDLCHCCCTSIIGKNFWICEVCPSEPNICETCESLGIDFEGHKHKKHKMTLSDKDGNEIRTKNGSKKKKVKTAKTKTSKVATSQVKTATAKTPKASECEAKLTNEVICKTTKCSTCSQLLHKNGKSYECKVCDYKMCANCFNSASFLASSGHSVTHDVGLHIGGSEMLVISGSQTKYEENKKKSHIDDVHDQSTTRNLPASTPNTQCAYMSGFNTGETQAPYMSNLGGTAAGVSTDTKKPSYLSNLGNEQQPYSPTTTVKTPIYASGTETQSPYMTGLGGGNPSRTQPAYTSGGVPTATKQPSYLSNLGNKQPSGSPTPKPAYMGNW